MFSFTASIAAGALRCVDAVERLAQRVPWWRLSGISIEVRGERLKSSITWTQAAVFMRSNLVTGPQVLGISRSTITRCLSRCDMRESARATMSSLIMDVAKDARVCLRHFETFDA